ncbi:hypothetical protein CAPTEDRAFT_172510 [Capitella teleta]|uniref:non-specific protein-tyrosine kinase n=1 Tax=Capitella teleta TaxID=283909 RepID=R7U0C9_CAPTE|nr:hypothetical protein CAPTEDRAFT_172510 [Capitella teleta]|eukprot:ELT99444.1 hypothetical protein CAPTEDRAFT_172510 [Capitella teleta]
MLSSTSYLDPRSYVKSSDKSGKFDKFKDGKFNFTPADLDIPKRILLKKDDHLVAENSEVFTPTEDVCRESPLHQFLSVSLAFDKSGSAFYIPTNLLKRYGDPEGESWFYPIPLSSRQATLFLEAEKQEGCFVVYRAMNSNVAYNLSVCRKNGDVVHYHIVENNHGDVMIRGHDHSFMNIQNLVKFFQGNKSQLATRLRRPLKEARLPIIPGYHYDARYELNRSSLNLTGKIIGKGHFGVVCSAVYRSSTVAVKVLQRSDLTTTDEDDFIEEARVMMGLKHDHVVRLLGVSCTAKPFFIVTEFISRGSLRDCLRQHNLPAESIDIFFDLCIQVTAAMYYLESQKYLLHRDVAARNFLLTEDMCVKLSDFGRACFVNDDNYQAAKSEKISIKWAAPEVLLNSTYSTKSDVWSIGVVYWEIFSAGARPYTEMSSEQATMYVIEGGRLDKPVGCSPDLYSIMKQCWRELPEERPSFTALYDKLKSKSSIYYVRTVRAEKTASLPLTTSMKVSSPNKPKLMTPKSQTLKPTKSRKLTIGVDDAYGDDQLDYGRKVSTLGSNQHHSSSSEVSLASQNQMDTSKDDIDRGGLIRKSLRKIGVIRRPKKKNSKIDLRMDDADRRSAGAFYSPN